MAIENAKVLNVRIRNKYDSYENWIASGLVLEAGEIAICYTSVDVKVDNGTAKHPALLMKVGNGTDTFANLPWMSAKAADVLAVCKNEAELKTFINGVIADAGIASDDALAALAGRVTTAEGEIDTLQSEMDAVEEKAAANEAAIAALDLLVGDDTVAKQIKDYVDGLNLADTYAAKTHGHEISEVNGLSDAIAAAKKAGTDANTALETYKTLNDAAVKVNTDAIAGIKNGTTLDNFAEVEEALAGKQAAGDYSVNGHKHEIADVTGLSAAIEAAAKAGTDAAAAAETAAKAYADGLAVHYDEAGAAAKALEDAKDYVDGLTGGESVSDYVDGVIANYSTTEQMNTAIGDAKDAAIAKANELNTAMNTRMQAVEGKAHEHTFVESELNLIQAGDVEKWNAAEQNAIDEANRLDGLMDARVQALEAKFGEGEGNVESQIEAAVAAEAALREAADTALDGRVAAIEADYLTSENETALQDQITALDELVGDKKVSEQITDVTDPLDARIKAVEDTYAKAEDVSKDVKGLQDQIDTILDNPDAEGAINSIKEFTAYIDEHKPIAEAFRTDINANAKAIEDETSRAAGVEAGLQTAIDGVAGDLTALSGVVDTKAAQTALDALDGRVEAIETELNTETTGLKARMTQAEADIDALETAIDTLVGDTEVATQIANAINEALKIKAEDGTESEKYALATELAAAIARIAQNETDIDTLESTKANDADLAAIAKTGSTDDLVQGSMVLVFDCGTSAV